MTRQALERWALKLEQLSPQTAKHYRTYLDGLFRSCGHSTATRISDIDVQRYINSIPSPHRQRVALAAIRGFLKLAGRTVKDITLTPLPQEKPIYPLTDDEFRALLTTAENMSHQPTRTRALLLLLRDTGGRIGAVLQLRREDIKDDHVILPAGAAKNRRHSIAPLRGETVEALAAHTRTLPDGVQHIFVTRMGTPMGTDTALKAIKQAGKCAGLDKRVYPHLFRHMKALELRAGHAEGDTVTQTMGWSTLAQYDQRYGQRTPGETMEEARRIMEGRGADGGRDAKAEAIAEMAAALREGKIDEATFQAGILSLRGSSKDIKATGDIDSMYG